MVTIFERALEFVTNGSVLGLGSGRAAQGFLHSLAQQRPQGLYVVGVPTSQATALLAQSLGIPLTTLADVGTIDLVIDGADEVAPNRDLIKGWGRALVREKIVASAAKKRVILVGEEKLVPKLGSRGKLPVEVVPFGWSWVMRRLQELGLRPALDVRDGQPYVTDNGNYILDCAVSPMDSPSSVEEALREIPGVVGTGLFLGLADVVLVGRGDSWELVEER